MHPQTSSTVTDIPHTPHWYLSPSFTFDFAAFVFVFATALVFVVVFEAVAVLEAVAVFFFAAVAIKFPPLINRH